MSPAASGTPRGGRGAATKAKPKAAARLPAASAAVDHDGPRGRRRDAEVLEAATKVFHEKSYADASVQDVADELGILKGSLYHYIKTKEDLLVWLLEGVHDDVEQLLREVQARTELAPLERLELYVREQVLYNARNLARISVYHHDSGRLSPKNLQHLERRRRGHEDVIVDLIRQGQLRGEVSQAVEARQLANCVFATMTGVYRWYKPGGRLRNDALADLCVGFAMAGVEGAGRRG